MIDTEALRKKVIDLAIQGKLTQQLPEDGSAEDLYTQIQEKKEALIKSGKIRKQKSLPKISDSEIPFKLPENWKWIRLNDLGVFGGGKTPSMNNSDYWRDGKIPWITSKDMKQKYLSTSQMLISECALETMTVYPPKSVLFVVRSGILKRMLPVAISLESTTINQDLKALCLYIPEMCEFAYYVLKGLESLILFKYAKEGTTVNNINFDNLLSMPIPLPPLREQNRIVELIDEVVTQTDVINALQQQYEFDREILKGKIIDAGIHGELTEQLPEDGNAEDLYAQIQEEKAKLIKEGKIKKEKKLPQISEDEIPFEIPNNWKWVHLFDCGVTQTGNTPSKTHPEYFGNDLSFIGPGNIVNGKLFYGRQGLSTIGKSFGRVCSPGSIMQVCIGGSIGKCAITDKETAFNQQINSLTPIMGVSKYLYYVLCSSYFVGIINRFAAGMATPIINKSCWGSLLVPLPPYKEQERIVESIDEVLLTLDFAGGGADEN